MITKPFAAYLSGPLEKDAAYLPLSQADTAKLLTLIPEEEFTYLTIKDDLYAEYVKAENQCGALLLTRGEGGTEARKFPKGSCVYFENSVAVTEWLICNYDCCAGDCPCELVAAAGLVLPVAKPGFPYSGAAIFTGDLPMTLAVVGVPDWLTITLGPNFVELRSAAVPSSLTTADTFPISIAATNCHGTGLAIQPGTITVEL